MPRFVPDPEVLRLGEALAALRRERGLSQAEAGARLDMTSQGWGLYEAGRRPGLFRPDVQRRLTGALDSTPEALALLAGGAPPELEEGVDPGVASRGRGFQGAGTPPNRRLVADDALFPWAARGVWVEFEPGLWPRSGQGCVVDLTDGSWRVRLFDQADDARLYLRGAGSLEEQEVLDRRQVARLSAVVARHER